MFVQSANEGDHVRDRVENVRTEHKAGRLHIRGLPCCRHNGDIVRSCLFDGLLEWGNHRRIRSTAITEATCGASATA